MSTERVGVTLTSGGFLTSWTGALLQDESANAARTSVATTIDVGKTGGRSVGMVQQTEETRHCDRIQITKHHFSDYISVISAVRADRAVILGLLTVACRPRRFFNDLFIFHRLSCGVTQSPRSDDVLPIPYLHVISSPGGLSDLPAAGASAGT